MSAVSCRQQCCASSSHTLAEEICPTWCFLSCPKRMAKRDALKEPKDINLRNDVGSVVK
jgi:hypothetical protein